jgi:hypothetical protein
LLTTAKTRVDDCSAVLMRIAWNCCAQRLVEDHRPSSRETDSSGGAGNCAAGAFDRAIFNRVSPHACMAVTRGTGSGAAPELVVGELRDDVPEISALARSGRPSQVVAESWSMTMKTMLLLSTLAGLVAATPSFAQSASDASNYSPAFGFPSYAPSGARSPNVNAPVSFGAWESGYALDGAGQVRTRNRQ